MGFRQTDAASDMGGGPRPACGCRVGVSGTQSGPRGWRMELERFRQSRTKAHQVTATSGSWQRKPVEPGRHSLGDSLLQVGVRGGKREGIASLAEAGGGMRLPHAPSPLRGSSWDAAPPVRAGSRCAPSLETPTPPGRKKWRDARQAREAGLRAGGRAQAGRRARPGPKGLPPGRPPPYAGPAADRRAPGALLPSWRRPCRRSRSACSASRARCSSCSRSHVAEPGLASLPAPLARPRVLSGRRGGPPPRTPPAGLPTGRGCRQQAAPLARSLARPALWPARAASAAEEDRRPPGDGRTGGRLRSETAEPAAQAARAQGGEGGPAPNGLQVTSPSINSCGLRPPQSRAGAVRVLHFTAAEVECERRPGVGTTGQAAGRARSRGPAGRALSRPQPEKLRVPG